MHPLSEPHSQLSRWMSDMVRMLYNAVDCALTRIVWQGEGCVMVYSRVKGNPELPHRVWRQGSSMYSVQVPQVSCYSISQATIYVLM